MNIIKRRALRGAATPMFPPAKEVIQRVPGESLLEYVRRCQPNTTIISISRLNELFDAEQSLRELQRARRGNPLAPLLGPLENQLDENSRSVLFVGGYADGETRTIRTTQGRLPPRYRVSEPLRLSEFTTINGPIRQVVTETRVHEYQLQDNLMDSEAYFLVGMGIREAESRLLYHLRNHG